MDFIKSVISKTCKDEFGRDLRIDYFITSGESLTDGVQVVPSYGICVKLYAEEKCLDSSKIDDISPSKDTVLRLIQLFAKNLVTPVTLSDVVEDSMAAL